MMHLVRARLEVDCGILIGHDWFKYQVRLCHHSISNGGGKKELVLEVS